MALILQEIINQQCMVEREFEGMGDKFLLVNIAVNIVEGYSKYQNLSPLHWRLGDGKNPPLDISVNSHNNIVKEISFFIADEKILHKNIHRLLPLEEGLPVFDNMLWANGEYYIDEVGNVKYFYFENSIYCAFNENNWNIKVKLSDTLTLIFDTDKKLVAIVLENLTGEEEFILKGSNLI